jgi:hypothetical protein
MLMQLPRLRTIEISDDALTMRVDADGAEAVRTIHFNPRKRPRDMEASPFGYSIGHWDGDTLVIDTIGFAPHPTGVGFGIPSSAGKHLIERLTLTPDKLQLRYELTIEDPEYLAAPASYAAVWDHRPELEPSGAACDPEIAQRFLDEEERGLR